MATKKKAKKSNKPARVGTVKSAALNRRKGRASTGSDRNLFFRETTKATKELAGKAKGAKKRELSAASSKLSKSGG